MRWNPPLSLAAAAAATLILATLNPMSAFAAKVTVKGKVTMSDVCSPEVSPAVVVLEPKAKGTVVDGSKAVPTDVALINQRGLQFVPRVQAIPLGSTLRFTNDDTETHNVHVLSPGNDFNESMAPGQPREFKPVKPGLVRLGCDVHSHMRGYVLVSESPFVQVCSAKGTFTLRDVPEGDYKLTVWHEMGDALQQDLTVATGTTGKQDVGELKVVALKRSPTAPGAAEPIRPWPDVIDRIGMMLTAALDCAGKPDGYKKGRKIAYDAYYAEFEATDMEAAVRRFLGLNRAIEIESQFRAVFKRLKEIADGQAGTAEAASTTRALLLALVKASDELNKQGIVDAAHLSTANTAATAVAELEPGSALDNSRDRGLQLLALVKALDEVVELADRNEADEAASRMVMVYFDTFEPLERFIAVRRPQDVPPLEAHFSAIRGTLGQGAKGNALSEAMARLTDDVKRSVDTSAEAQVGTFASAFGISLITIVREGVEVILLLAMLFALVAKTGQIGARKAIYGGVGLAAVASALTALALNRMVDAAQGRSRETLEGAVMLSAAAVLFYVSYWLISQSESKRWMTFLKTKVAEGTGGTLGFRGFATLAATSFLAVYREGAETALMYQAMAGSQNGSKEGLSGLLAGLLVGLAVLTVIAFVLRATTVKLPLRRFFQATGAFLFALAVVFAGNGVFELQQSGLLKTTPIVWLGTGLPLLGVHPSLQALSVQGLLVAGAVMALLVLLTESKGTTIDAQPIGRKGGSASPAPTVGVGV